MAYALEQDESLISGVRRIADEQVDDALEEIKDSSLDAHDTVHQVRKRCKKIRGLLRLVRPGMEDTYQCENEAYRDAARLLSRMRDSQTKLDTYDTLTKWFDEQVDRRAMGSIRRRLTLNQVELMGDDRSHEQLDEFREAMEKARSRIGDWRIEGDEPKALRAGIEKTYRRGRNAMDDAYRKPSPERFHEWRKRVKYYWYHVRLIQDMWPAVLQPLAKELHELSDYLGDDHDLAVLCQSLQAHPSDFGSERDVEAFVGLAEQRRVELESTARPLGRRLFADKPSALTSRVKQLWKIWR